MPALGWVWARRWGYKDEYNLAPVKKVVNKHVYSNSSVPPFYTRHTLTNVML